jgi:Fe-S-cluster containining protein
MFKQDISSLKKNIQVFKQKGYLDKLQKIYRKFPVTTCDGCGTCCSDSPLCTYPEFLFTFELFDRKFTELEKIEVLKKSIREFMYGLVTKNKRCAFLSENNTCQIYERSPLACKRWGLQSKEDNDCDFKLDLERNKQYQEFYVKQGIYISDKVVNKQLKLCQKVKVIKNPYNFSEYDFDGIVKKDLLKMMITFQPYLVEDWSLCNYLVYIFLGEKLVQDRIAVIKDFQNGNDSAVEQYIESINYSNIF